MNFYFVLGGEFLQEVTVVGNFNIGHLTEVVKAIGQCHIAVSVVVSIAFAVGGDVNELCFRRLRVECVKELVCEVFPVVEVPFEGYAHGEVGVVKEDGDGATGGQLAEVRSSAVDAIGPMFGVYLAISPGLIWG